MFNARSTLHGPTRTGRGRRACGAAGTRGYPPRRRRRLPGGRAPHRLARPHSRRAARGPGRRPRRGHGLRRRRRRHRVHRAGLRGGAGPRAVRRRDPGQRPRHPRRPRRPDPLRHLRHPAPDPGHGARRARHRPATPGAEPAPVPGAPLPAPSAKATADTATTTNSPPPTAFRRRNPACASTTASWPAGATAPSISRAATVTACSTASFTTTSTRASGTASATTAPGHSSRATSSTPTATPSPARGAAASGYEARNNVEMGRSLSHCFDMHGGRDRKDGTDVAGGWMHVHPQHLPRPRPARRGDPRHPGGPGGDRAQLVPPPQRGRRPPLRGARRRARQRLGSAGPGVWLRGGAVRLFSPQRKGRTKDAD